MENKNNALQITILVIIAILLLGIFLVMLSNKNNKNYQTNNDFLNEDSYQENQNYNNEDSEQIVNIPVGDTAGEIDNENITNSNLISGYKLVENSGIKIQIPNNFSYSFEVPNVYGGMVPHVNIGSSTGELITIRKYNSLVHFNEAVPPSLFYEITSSNYVFGNNVGVLYSVKAGQEENVSGKKVITIPEKFTTIDLMQPQITSQISTILSSLVIN